MFKDIAFSRHHQTNSICVADLIRIGDKSKKLGDLDRFIQLYEDYEVFLAQAFYEYELFRF